MADRDDSFLKELGRRNVFRVGIAYVVASWLLLQVVDVLTDILELPEWVPKFFLVVLAVGFALAVIFAWAYEMTPEGLKLEKDVDRSRSITSDTGKRLDRVTMAILVAAVAFLLVDKYVFVPGEPLPEESSPGETAPGPDKLPSIAVLPFTNMSADESSGYFSDGLADTLLHMLAQVRELRVAARTSSFQFRDPGMDIRNIGEQLQVTSVLEGSVQKSGNKIRVTAQLIDVSDGYHIWSGNFDRELDDIFAIQDEIAAKVVDALQVSLLGGEAEQLTKRQTENIDAYTEYMLGIDAMALFSFESLPRAEEHFEKAISLDPNYALARVRLAQTYIEMFDTGMIGYDAFMAQTPPVLDHALTNDPDSPIALAVQGALLSIQDRDAEAEATLRRAMQLGPSEVLPRMYLARLLQYNDRPQEALEVVEQALNLDPLSRRALGRSSSINRELENYDAARDTARRIRQLDPLSPIGYYMEAFIDWDDDRPASAIRLMEKAGNVDPLDPELPVQIGDWYVDLGESDGARYWYQKGVAIDPNHPMSLTGDLYIDVLAESNVAESAAYSRRLLEKDIDNRKGSRDLAILALFLDGHARGEYDEYLGHMQADYPAFFTDSPTVPAFAGPLQGTRIAYAMMQSGEVERGKRLASAMLEAINEESGIRGYRPNALHVAALAGDNDVVQTALAELKTNIGIVSFWDLSEHLYPWSHDVFEHPDLLGLKVELEARNADRRARVEAQLGRPWIKQKGTPPN